MAETPTVKATHGLQAALTSIAIGCAISLITVLLQALVGWLQNLQPEIPGAVVGVGKFLYSWRHQG